MSISAEAKNQALNGWVFTEVSAHDAYPGTTGANEISGSTRASVTVATASGGQRLASNASMVLPASTCRWLGWWAGTTFLFPTPNGGAVPKNFTASAATDLIHCPGHGYADTTRITFWGGVAPTGLTAGDEYFVRDATTDTFKVAATSGGTAIDITGNSGAGCWVSAITPKTYATTSAHTVLQGTFLVPN